MTQAGYGLRMTLGITTKGKLNKIRRYSESNFTFDVMSFVGFKGTTSYC